MSIARVELVEVVGSHEFVGQCLPEPSDGNVIVGNAMVPGSLDAVCPSSCTYIHLEEERRLLVTFCGTHAVMIFRDNEIADSRFI